MKSMNCWDNFTSAIKTEATKTGYTSTMEKFKEFCNLKEYCDFKELPPERLKELIISYVRTWKDRGLSYSSCNNYLSAIELFLDMNEIAYPKRIIRRMLPANNKKAGGDVPYTRDEINRMLEVTYNLKTKFIIHLFNSTGGRPNALHDPPLILGDVVDMPEGCKAVLIYRGSKEEYWTFWTPECVKAFNDYLASRRYNGEYLTNESPLLESKGKPLSYRAIRHLLLSVLNKAGIERVKVGARFDKALFYGFRKRFNTILKIDNDVNSNIAEKLMAHKKGLDGAYLKPTREECFTEFRKAIKEITLSEVQKQKQIITEQEKNLSDHNILQEQINELTKRDEQKQKVIDMLLDFQNTGIVWKLKE
jgi:integrase